MVYYDFSKKRTKNYVFTVTSLNDPQIAMAKKNMKAMGLGGIRVRARIGKNNPNAHRYHRGGDLYRMSYIDYKPEHGVRWDVYRRAS